MIIPLFFNFKPFKDLPKQTWALIWLYLHLVGKPAEPLLLVNNLWTFNRVDFKNALMTLWLNDKDEKEDTILQMKDLISKHLPTNKKIGDWARDMFVKVHKFKVFMIRQPYYILSKYDS